MQFIPLGTTSATPTRTRGMSCYALRFDNGATWLFDCAEGSQMRMLASDIRPPRIERIFITHLHGDHVLGLPGLLLSMSLHGRQDPVIIHGPHGLQELVDCTLRLTGSHLPFVIQIEECAHQTTVLDVKKAHVVAHPIAHALDSFAFHLVFPSRRGQVDMEAVRACGLEGGPLVGRLAAGEDITLENGSLIRSNDVCGPERPGASLLICGDTSSTENIPVPDNGLDLLMHEATYDDNLADKAATWGHSCAGDAGRAAKRLKARLLLISHFSARYSDEDGSIQRLVDQAQAQAPACRVLPAQDLQPLHWTGSDFNEIPCAIGCHH